MWHIMGAGAIGTLFACQLQQANIPVRIIARKQVSCQHTIDCQLDEGKHSATFSISADLPSSQHSIKQLILSTKAHQSMAAIDTIQHRLTDDTAVLIIQNGMGVAEQIRSRFPALAIAVASTTEGAHRINTGHVIHAGRGETRVGPWEARDEAATRQLYNGFQQIHLKTAYDNAIHTRLWAKLAINCAINPLTVIFNCPNGELLTNLEALALMEKVCIEVSVIAKRCLNKPLDIDLFETVKAVAAATGANISSMLQDIRNNRTTEIDYINGYIVRVGRQLQLPVAINETLVDRVRAHEK